MSDFDDMHNPNWDRIIELGLNSTRGEFENFQIHQNLSSNNNFNLNNPSSYTGPRTWVINIDRYSCEGTLSSDDADGEVKITGNQDLLLLYRCINDTLNDHGKHYFLREKDGAKVLTYESQQVSDAIVVQREDGCWFRLSRPAAVAFMQEIYEIFKG